MKVNKWNFATKKYEQVEVDDDIKMLYRDLDKIIKCINCKKSVQYGNTYSSLKYHNEVGLAYPVCAECYEKEWAERKKYEELEKQY